MLSDCITHATADSDEMPAESNRCPATGREYNAICVPQTAVQTLQEGKKGNKAISFPLLILCAYCGQGRIIFMKC